MWPKATTSFFKEWFVYRYCTKYKFYAMMVETKLNVVLGNNACRQLHNKVKVGMCITCNSYLIFVEMLFVANLVVFT
jgi:hypothetical protein